jgi:uncharacterized protein involved in outer membrane biogenesis
MVLAGIAVLLVILVVGGIVFTGTYYGRERVRRIALDAVRDMVNGEVHVGRIEGNLLDRFELVDVSITDTEGRPFLVADRISARLSLSALLSKQIVINAIELDRPVVTLSKVPGGDWNYEEIFPTEDTASPDEATGFGSWVDLHSLTIRNGTLLVHQPYVSDERISQIVGDSAFQSAVARETRLRVDRVSYGLRQTMEFKKKNKTFATTSTTDIAANPSFDPCAIRSLSASTMAEPSGNSRLARCASPASNQTP